MLLKDKVRSCSDVNKTAYTETKIIKSNDLLAHTQPEGSVATYLFGYTKLFTIGKNDIHMFVKSHESTNQSPAIVESDTHSVVDKLEHLAVF